MYASENFSYQDLAGSRRRTLRSVFAACLQRYRQRRRLGVLDDRLLDDIGVSREEARAEAGRPFWDGRDQ